MEKSTSIERGDVWTVVRISSPVVLFLLWELLVALCERIFLSSISTEAVASSLNGTYLVALFQLPCVVIASMAQVFVGLYQGRQELKKIGPCVWQLIWFSFLSMLITVPLSLWSSSLYFKGTVLQAMGSSYVWILTFGNFLFPLYNALISFYLGRGKTLFVTTVLLIIYAFNLVCCKILILGVDGWVPPLGIRGAAWAKCLSLGLLCCILFKQFLSSANREIYATDQYQLSLPYLGTYVRSGFARAFGFFWSRGCWLGVSYMMIKKGGIYMDVLTVGGTIISFLIFIPLGVYRAVLTITPNLLGQKKIKEVWRLVQSLILYVLFLGAIVALPLLLYPQSLIYFFDADLREAFERTFKIMNHWIWLYFLIFTLQMVLRGLNVAVRDLKVQFFCYFLTPVTSFLPVYLALEWWGWGADKMWVLMSLECVIFGLIFFFRFRQGKWEEESLATS